jgi:hypothetical protein
MSRERIVVNDLTKASGLAALADNPDVRLDVTKLDLGRLPEHVKAALYTEATTFSAPQLQTSGYIYAPRATSFSVPQLQRSGNIAAPKEPAPTLTQRVRTALAPIASSAATRR